MRVSGGTAPYSWSASAPDGLELAVDGSMSDGSLAQVFGTLVRSGSMTVSVIDSANRRVTRSYDLQVRDKCWLTYVSLENGSPQLHVVDPILTTFSAPNPSNKDGVNDFQFSPDGRYLAYRFGVDVAHSDSGHLSLLDMLTGLDSRLDFSEEAVASYTWSRDSAVLAVAYRKGATTYLGGIRLDQPVDGGAATADSVDGAADLPPKAAILQPVVVALNSPLLWFGTSYVAYYGPSVSGAPALAAAFSKLGGEGFQAPTTSFWDSFPPARLLPAEDGFFAISEAVPVTVVFNPVAGGVPPIHDANVVSPSGAFTAPPPTGRLALFRAVDDPAFADPWAETAGCSQLLAWAKDRERLACITDVTDPVRGESHGEIRIFDLDAAARRIDVSTVAGSCIKATNSLDAATPCSASEYDYTQTKAIFRRRAFSPSGRWFAFATTATEASVGDDYLYWADLQSNTKQLKRKRWSPFGGGPDGSQIELAFSSDESLLLEQRGTTLAVHDLNEVDTDPIRRVGTELKAPSSCSEDFASASDRWCGNVTNTAAFVWSPDPKLAVFKTSNALTSVELTPDATRLHEFTMVDCNEKCSGQFALQP